MRQRNMGLLARIFGTKEPLIESKVIFKSDGGSETSISIDPLETNYRDIMALLLLHYAKMLLIVPKNFYGTTPFIQIMLSTSESSEFYKGLVLNFSSLEMDFIATNARVSRKDRTFTTKLIRSRENEWFIKTGIPPFGHTSQALISIKELIRKVVTLKLLNDHQIAVLQSALRKMSLGYLQGVDYRSISGSQKFPTKCLLEAISELKVNA